VKIQVDRILIVDDELAIREFLSEELRQAGYQAATAASGEEALAYLEGHPVDLVLLDLRMTGMDGLETMAAIYRRPSPPEVIMLTAHATLDTAVAAMRQGGQDFLAKPCTHAELLTSVHRGLLRRQEALQRNAVARLIADAARQLTGDTVETPSSSPLAPDRYLHGQDLLLDQHARVVWRASRQLELTPTEFDLLAAFMRQPNRLWPYKDLALEILGRKMSTAEARRALGTHLWRLRRKLAEGPGGTPYIINLRGRGYRFVS